MQAQVLRNRPTNVLKIKGHRKTAFLHLSVVGLAKCSGDKYFTSMRFREVTAKLANSYVRACDVSWRFHCHGAGLAIYIPCAPKDICSSMYHLNSKDLMGASIPIIEAITDLVRSPLHCNQRIASPMHRVAEKVFNMSSMRGIESKSLH